MRDLRECTECNKQGKKRGKSVFHRIRFRLKINPKATLFFFECSNIKYVIVFELNFLVFLFFINFYLCLKSLISIGLQCFLNIMHISNVFFFHFFLGIIKRVFTFAPRK